MKNQPKILLPQSDILQIKVYRTHDQFKKLSETIRRLELDIMEREIELSKIRQQKYRLEVERMELEEKIAKEIEDLG